MGIIDLFKKNSELCLQIINLENWPEQLVRKQNLDSEMKKFLKRFEQKKKKLNEAKTKLTNPSIEVPPRAKEIFDEHSQIVIKEIDNLLEKSDFIDDLFLLEEQKNDLTTLIVIFRDVTRKSFSALKEFANQELLTITRALNELEDELLALNPLFEKTGFERILETKKLIDNYRSSRGKAGFVNRKKKEVELRINFLEEKKEKIIKKIKHYKDNAKPSAKNLIEQEEELLMKIEEINNGEETGNLKALEETLANLRRKMINNITAMNINEQRRFLEGVEQDLKTLRSNYEEVDNKNKKLSLNKTVEDIKKLLEGFEVIFEDGSLKDILE